MSREKFAQRLAEGIQDMIADAVVDAMRPVREAQYEAVKTLRRHEGVWSDAFDTLEESLGAAVGLFEIRAEDLPVSGLVDDEIDTAGLVDESEVECREAQEQPTEFLELLGISEHDQAMAGENLSADDKLRRWSQLPTFRATILRLATQICDEEDLAKLRPAYVFRPEQHDTSPSALASSPGWHAQAIAKIKTSKKRGVK